LPLPICENCGAEFLTEDGVYCRVCRHPRVSEHAGSVTITHTATGGFDDLDGVGTGEYADIRPGAQVTVRDESGADLGVGVLGLGHPAEWSDDGSGRYRSCVFLFVLRGLPRADSYSVTIGERPPVTCSGEEGIHITL
jgi:hypothetical protein